jgi:hypothetical protein
MYADRGDSSVSFTIRLATPTRVGRKTGQVLICPPNRLKAVYRPKSIGFCIGHQQQVEDRGRNDDRVLSHRDKEMDRESMDHLLLIEN